MSRAAVITVAAGAALLGAGYFMRRGGEVREQSEPWIIPIITPVIDLGMAELVLAAMERVPGQKITLVLHTQGGCVASCVMIAKALRHFPDSTAIVPYMAISGGTLIALSASRLEMGRSAALSAVDPIVLGQRAKHVPEGRTDDQGLGALAREYEVAITQYMRSTLAARLQGQAAANLDRAMELFMGRNAPHEWPILMSEVETLGLPVTKASRQWSTVVDEFRRRWW